MLLKAAQGDMGGKENEQMGVGQDWICFYIEKEYGIEKDEEIGHIVRKNSIEKRGRGGRGGGGEVRGRGGEGEEGEGGRDREFLPRNIPVATGIPMLPF